MNVHSQTLNYRNDMGTCVSKDGVSGNCVNKNSVNRNYLVNIMQKTFVSDDKAYLKKMVDFLFEKISTALICGDKIELRMLGSMQIKVRKSKTMTNPQTGNVVAIPPRAVLYFRASKKLLALLN